jgi:competence protein ComEC
MRFRAKTTRWVLLAFVAGLVAHLGSWPLVAFHFNLFSVVAPSANVLIAPLAEGLILIGLAAMALAWVPFAGAGFFVLLLAPGLRLLRALTLCFAAPPWAAVSTASPPIWLLLVYYALLWGLAPLVRERVLRKTLFAPGPPAAPGAARAAGGAVAPSPSR